MSEEPELIEALAKLLLRPRLHAGSPPAAARAGPARVRQPAEPDGVRPVPKRAVIKEPNGSHAADTIVSLLPRSRVLFLLRDGENRTEEEQRTMDEIMGAKLAELGYEV